MGFLAGKKALIVGVASTRSIAWGIAQAFHREGAELAFTYQNEKLKKRVDDMSAKVGSSISIEMDVATDSSIQGAFSELSKHWDNFDIVIHSVGFAPRDQLDGRFTDSTTREGYQIAHGISAYSLIALAKYAKPMLNDQAAILALTYLGAIRAVPNYNVMGPAKASLEASIRFLAADLGVDGIRVNGISAGPIKTLAAVGVAGFREMLSNAAEKTPLKRTVTQEEVGNATAFLCSNLASGITGEILYVDAGQNIMGAT
jgi:enoyl-[acyl-carrier protein] reductase I